MLQRTYGSGYNVKFDDSEFKSQFFLFWENKKSKAILSLQQTHIHKGEEDHSLCHRLPALILDLLNIRIQWDLYLRI